MTRFATFVLRHKLLVVLAWLAVAVAGGFAAARIEDRLTPDFAQPGLAGFEANRTLERRYGTGGDDPPLVAVIGLPPGRTVDDPGMRAAIARPFAAVAERLHARTLSYADTGDRAFVSADGRTTFGIVYTAPAAGFGGDDLTGPVAQIMRPALPPGATVQVTGLEALSESEAAGEGVSVFVEVVIGGVGALAVLLVVFGSVLAIVPLVIAIISVLVSFLALYGLTGVTDVHMIVQYVVALLALGVAIDYSLLLVTRWREERARGHEGDAAVIRAMATAGRSVVVSGGAVALGLIAMMVLPVPYLRSVGYGGALIPLVSVLAVLTLPPVVLATAGARMDWPRRAAASALPGAAAGRRWQAWGRLVIRFRRSVLVGTTVLLAALSCAAFGLRLGEPQSSSLPKAGPAYEGLVSLRDAGFPTGVLTPMDVILPPGVDPTAEAARLARVPGVLTVAAPEGWRADGTALLAVLPEAESGTEAGRRTITEVRRAVAPGAQVAGEGAQSIDFVDAVYGSFPAMLALIAVVTYLALVRAFRSLLLPLKAVLLNLLSVAAAIGTTVLVWQYGHGTEPIFGLAATGALPEFIPVMVFAFLYGLSMDYEVFLLARMREEYDRTGSTTAAITHGLGRTGRLVTSAALILFLALVSLAAAPEPEVKIFATGLGVGILLDATVVRALLVPAFVSLMGRWNWWLPTWAARLLRVPPAPAAPYGTAGGDGERPRCPARPGRPRGDGL
ncbi:MAG: MMPL family transporter [Actinomycetes bacterium]|nr:MAG: MMPL family transporter [Actinomycetota bacterium]